MNQNPYQAPTAALSDPLLPEPPKPAQVQLAVRTMWVVFVVGLISLHPWIRGDWWAIKAPDVPEAGPVFTVIMVAILLFSSVTSAVLIWLVSRRHGWARWGVLVWVLVGFWGLVADLPSVWAETPLALIVDSATVLLDAACCYLLFFGDGAKWFRPTPSA